MSRVSIFRSFSPNFAPSFGIPFAYRWNSTSSTHNSKSRSLNPAQPKSNTPGISILSVQSFTSSLFSAENWRIENSIKTSHSYSTSQPAEIFWGSKGAGRKQNIGEVPDTWMEGRWHLCAAWLEPSGDEEMDEAPESTIWRFRCAKYEPPRSI